MAKRKQRRTKTGTRRSTGGRRTAAGRRTGTGKRTSKKAAARKATSGRKRPSRKGARKSPPRKSARAAAARKSATRKSAARKSATRKTAARKTAARKPATRKTAAQSRPSGRPAAARKMLLKRPGGQHRLQLDRTRRVLEESIPGPPSSLDLDRHASAARTGRAELREALAEHTESSPRFTGGDVDANWASAFSTGDEAPGGDMPTPDQDVVEEIGSSLGVRYADDEELKAVDKIEKRDRQRWELDPASSEDYRDRAGKKTE